MEDFPLFYVPDATSGVSLGDDEVAHALRVLRLGEGARILITDGKERLWLAELTEVGRKSCNTRILRELPWAKPWSNKIGLYISMLKSAERMEWAIEKAIEIGVDHIVIFNSRHSERKKVNRERVEKIMLSAMKQSQKALLPELVTNITFDEALRSSSGSERLVLHCHNAGRGLRERSLPHKAYTTGQDVSLFIGPEGDFSREEILQAEGLGARSVTLGETRLRAETAGVVALQWIHTLNIIH